MGGILQLQEGALAPLSLFVDTSVWSQALRRDAPPPVPEVRGLASALQSGESIFTTGLVLQEILQGFGGPKSRQQILAAFASIPVIVPDREDHIEAADLRNRCRRGGIQAGTLDALLAQLCIHHELTMLSTDTDFHQIARHSTLRVWMP